MNDAATWTASADGDDDDTWFTEFVCDMDTISDTEPAFSDKEVQTEGLALQENADQETVSTLLSISRSVLKEVSNREEAIKKTNRVVN